MVQDQISEWQKRMLSLLLKNNNLNVATTS